MRKNDMRINALLTIFCLVLFGGWSHPGCSETPNGSFVDRYGQWKFGPANDPSFFPIAVWLQNPSNAEKYKSAGINLYVGLWKGPTEDQLTVLKKAGMRVICDQNAVGLAHRNDPIIAAWMHNDEPDNAQPVIDPTTGKKTYGPPIPPDQVIQDYEKIRNSDPSRPVFLNLGQGVANDEWKGRGTWGKPEDYLSYWKGCDILSYDVYPVAGLSKPDGENYLWYVAKGVQRLLEWSQGEKTVWNCIECTHISDENAKATPQQVKAEVWMSLIHGSMGIIYFVHEFQPKFNEHALLDDPDMLQEVTQLNQQIHAWAPLLNSPSIEGIVSVESSHPNVPVDCMVKRDGGTLYVFAVGMRNEKTTGIFSMRKTSSTQNTEVKVLHENRSIPLENNRFEDEFEPYDVHIYEITQ